MGFVPHTKGFNGLSLEDIKMFEEHHKEIMSETSKIKRELEDIKPNEYELKIKDLENENKKLKEENYKIISNVENLDKMIEKLINYIDEIEEVKNVGGVRVEHRNINDFELNEIRYSEVIIPELRLIKRDQGGIND